MISPDAAMPESGKSLAKPFAVTMMSGRIPKCWNPQNRPVQPYPVCTSSRTSRMPYRSARSRPRRCSPLAHLGDWNCLQLSVRHCWSIPTATDSHRVPDHRRRRQRARQRTDHPNALPRRRVIRCQRGDLATWDCLGQPARSASAVTDPPLCVAARRIPHA
jgi:hypothetical protein